MPDPPKGLALGWLVVAALIVTAVVGVILWLGVPL